QPRLADPHSPALLEAARAGFETFLFACPLVGSLLHLSHLWRRLRPDILSWLVPIERLARRLVLIEALALQAARGLPPLPPQAGGAPRKRATPSPPDLESDPETWRIVFNVAARRRGEAGGAAPAANVDAAPSALAEDSASPAELHTPDFGDEPVELSI